eukprot:GHVL01039178.1.p1 GENE.GHVL01039178.1~~GHVL01039178.1.p1  ORF type:complete len:278 (+),score=78.50 GHVL01039178.1:218-1051(+)
MRLWKFNPPRYQEDTHVLSDMITVPLRKDVYFCDIIDNQLLGLWYQTPSRATGQGMYSTSHSAWEVLVIPPSFTSTNTYTKKSTYTPISPINKMNRMALSASPMPRGRLYNIIIKSAKTYKNDNIYINNHENSSPKYSDFALRTPIKHRRNNSTSPPIIYVSQDSKLQFSTPSAPVPLTPHHVGPWTSQKNGFNNSNEISLKSVFQMSNRSDTWSLLDWKSVDIDEKTGDVTVHDFCPNHHNGPTPLSNVQKRLKEENNFLSKTTNSSRRSTSAESE